MFAQIFPWLLFGIFCLAVALLIRQLVKPAWDEVQEENKDLTEDNYVPVIGFVDLDDERIGAGKIFVGGNSTDRAGERLTRNQMQTPHPLEDDRKPAPSLGPEALKAMKPKPKGVSGLVDKGPPGSKRTALPTMDGLPSPVAFTQAEEPELGEDGEEFVVVGNEVETPGRPQRVTVTAPVLVAQRENTDGANKPQGRIQRFSAQLRALRARATRRNHEDNS